ncbi:MAG: hypothetical protein AAF501_04355 [Pseudomonadota bacterium]
MSSPSSRETLWFSNTGIELLSYGQILGFWTTAFTVGAVILAAILLFGTVAVWAILRRLRRDWGPLDEPLSPWLVGLRIGLIGLLLSAYTWQTVLIIDFYEGLFQPQVSSLLRETASWSGLLFAPILLLMNRRKPLILVLRKFNDDEMTHSLRRAFLGPLYQRFRMITLDDGVFPSASLHATSIGAALLMMLASFGVLSLTSSYIAYFDAATDIQEAFYLTYALDSFSVLSAPMITAALTLILVSSIGTFLSLHTRKMRVAKATDIIRVVRYIDLARTRLFSLNVLIPNAALVQTDHSLWQDTVKAAISKADLVLIDVSNPSGAIDWELNILAKVAPEKTCVALLEGVETPHLPSCFSPVVYARSQPKSLLRAAVDRVNQQIHERPT